ncbi:roadblock/LC7 domain-containing protein [Thermodesulforhabdus norvegica]|uniref:Predicted regulator of Ras-like GTPase activity, Roadblock/LC7/MglB family n=1 Tax=Thermodesulforhabdus norvegica TaxID=39841 RepID=A0A1I4QLX9_9BACT|nr:roadblock/LC7 domain-containing protein [Thermodesulforhabdus norvegica]SFM41102.1 Predicted regulator of Ras-like GTPase activity, Roadblock/LC7/MglB family [Thermodesulforhabdus norvegica]
MDLVLTPDKQEQLTRLIEDELIANGATHVFLVDTSGALIVEKGMFDPETVLPLAALSAANFGATAEIARLVGEQDFTLLFHKGEKHNIHFSKIGDDYILVVLFDKNVALGLIRLKIEKIANQVLSILEAN